jgi:hypothetical protein
MQRDYVWKAKKVTKLLDSLYRRWPIGSFYVWRTEGDHPTKARVGAPFRRPLDGFYGFLLDGQQRLTSLSLAIQGEAEGEFAQRAFFDLENETFYLGSMKRTIAKRVEAGDPLIVPLSDIVVCSPDDTAYLRHRAYHAGPQRPGKARERRAERRVPHAVAEGRHDARARGGTRGVYRRP